VFCVVLMLGTALGVTACGNGEKKAGQVLVRVNGEEITILQVNDELKRAGVRPEKQEAATKQLVVSLIDRQLILGEAMRNEIDRTTSVVQAIERAKAQIIAQAYLRSLESKIAKPTRAEIEDYYTKHPEYFTQRKQFEVQQLVLSTKDISSELKSSIDAAPSLDAVVLWLDRHNVKYTRGLLARSSTDLPEAMLLKLKDVRRGQLFIVNEGENSMINSIIDIRNNPVAAQDAMPQIEQYLINKKIKDVAEAEIMHLRKSAKIEYLSASVAP
jgi:peptidyl-prolyl cis-trans isomerase C